MGNEYLSNIPIYIQIMDELKLKIISGVWEPGQRLNSVRELAVEFSVNPNTMQRALSELEREGLLYTERTSGKYVSSDKKEIDRARDELGGEYTDNYFISMEKLGYTTNEIEQLLEKRLKERKDNK